MKGTGVAPQDWLVWSNEHQSYWRANSCGYTTDILQAGRYTKAQADDICAHARSHVKGQPPPEVAHHIGDTTLGAAFELERDAARYRAIRRTDTEHMKRTLIDWANDPLAPFSELDAAVDHAIAVQKATQKGVS